MTSRNLDAIKNLATPPPAGVVPGVVFDGIEGWVTTYATDGDEPSKEQVDQILRTSGLDPDEVTVDWSAKPRISTHIGPDGELLNAWFKFGLRSKLHRGFDVEDLVDSIYGESDKPHADTKEWRTIQVGDCHIGKSVIDGAGSEMLVDRWKDSVTNALSLGGDYEGIHLPFMGDLIEGEVSQGGANIANNDLALTEQLRVARHLVSWTIQEALLAGTRIIVSAVPGNHGQTTRAQNRPHTDNHDIDIVNAVQQAFDMTDHQDRITWYYPQAGSSHIAYGVGGTGFVSIHGHTLKGQLAGAEKWWAGMSASNAPAGNANILMAGHYHSPLVSNYTRTKWIVYGGALEDKSTWLNESNGATSKPGMMTYVTDRGVPSGFTVV